MKRPKLHPACKIFPPLAEAELQELADDIAANGLQNPIVLYQGMILDGRNRWDACKIAKIDPQFREFEGDDPLSWVISQNLTRRHLTASQRAVIALDLLPLLEREAKERQRQSNGRGKKVRKNSVPFPENSEAAENAARITKSNAKYIRSAKQIKEQAPELINEIRSGRVSIMDAEKLADLPEARRRQLLSQTNGNGDIFAAWKQEEKKVTAPKGAKRTSAEKQARLAATTLICGDCRKKLMELPSESVDLLLCDPPYPEIKRAYGKLSESQWHDLMHAVVQEAQRIVKPSGSAVFILQPNFDKLGKMRLWLWEFLLWAAKKWNLVQDCYWWANNTLPTTAANCWNGLLRQSVKTCLWLGSPDCYRDQGAVLWEPSDEVSALKWSDRALRNRPSGHSIRSGRTAEAAAERGGTTPFNLLPIPAARTVHGHPAPTPYDLAAWWCQYLLPPGGILLDPFCGGGTMLQAGLDARASTVIGIDKVSKYLTTAKKRIRDN